MASRAPRVLYLIGPRSFLIAFFPLAASVRPHAPRPTKSDARDNARTRGLSPARGFCEPRAEKRLSRPDPRVAVRGTLKERVRFKRAPGAKRLSESQAVRTGKRTEKSATRLDDRFARTSQGRLVPNAKLVRCTRGAIGALKRVNRKKRFTENEIWNQVEESN